MQKFAYEGFLHSARCVEQKLKQKNEFKTLKPLFEMAVSRTSRFHVSILLPISLIGLLPTLFQSTPSTIEKKVQLLNRWKEELGHLLLSELSPAHVAMVLDKLLSETTFKKAVRSSSTVNRYLAAFSKVFSVAVQEWGWLEENPILKISKPKESRGRDRFLTQEEVHRILEACKESTTPHLYAIVALAIFTGKRYGEIVKLQWKDINFELGFITLQQTKNSDKRIVPITNETVYILQSCPSYGSATQEQIFKSRKRTSSALPLSIRKSFAKALKAAQIESFRFHELRHTAASLFLLCQTLAKFVF